MIKFALQSAAPERLLFYIQLPDSDPPGLLSAVTDALDTFNISPEKFSRPKNLAQLSKLISQLCEAGYIVVLDEFRDQLLVESDELHRSPPAFLNHIVDRLYGARQLRAKSSRLIAARMPDQWIMATYPFVKQPKLNKRKIVTIHDSLDYMTKKQNILLIGPTGVGKTGLGTSFLVNAIISDTDGTVSADD